MQVYNPPVYDRVVGLNSNISKPKIIEITNWNMDTGATKDVAHGLTLSAISGVEVLIDNDDISDRRKLDSDKTLGGCRDGGFSLDATNVAMVRKEGGAFDGATYAGTGHRGWIKLWNKG